MSLVGLQHALAALFTDSRERDAYETDRAAFCRSYGLDARERAQLDALAESAVATYAATLLRKRCAEALRLLPELNAALGDRFAPAFSAWAARTPLGEGPDRYNRDAAAFSDYVRRHGGGPGS